jgi:DNA polymerase-3 subunit epsilon
LEAAGLVDPGRDIPAGATKVHGITTEQARAEGMPLKEAVQLVAETLMSASARGVPVVGMKLDYDLTILDTQLRRFWGVGLIERGWSGPVLDAVVLDRHFDRFRKGSRTLGALCDIYGVDIGHAHDASADALASIRVLLALAMRYKPLRDASLESLHLSQITWHREWAESFDGWRSKKGMAPIDPRDYVWPVAPQVLPAA